MQAFVGLMILRFVESKKQKEGKTNRSWYSGLFEFWKILNLWLSGFLTDHWHDHMIQAAPMQFLLELDFLTVGKVSAICRACTRAPVHLVQFETGFRRRYHLERSRHFWGNIYLRINRVQFRKRMWMKKFSQGGTSLCSTPKTCCKWEDAGNTPWKVLFRFKDPNERLWKMWHSLDMYKNAIGFIKGCVGWNSLQWSTTSWHGAWQGRANKDQVDCQERGWRLDNDLYQGICEDSQLHSIWLQGAKPRTLSGFLLKSLLDALIVAGAFLIEWLRNIMLRQCYWIAENILKL